MTTKREALVAPVANLLVGFFFTGQLSSLPRLRPVGAWIADLWISPATAAKIQARHGLTAQEVATAVVQVAGLQYRWHYHAERGRRLLVEVVIRNTRVLVVLYPRLRDAYGDAWDLGSAYPIGR
jgi:hypothetical protein